MTDTTAGAPPTHAADQAGGEVVYSSDNINTTAFEPLQPPSSIRKQRDFYEDLNATDDTSTVDTGSLKTAEQAFEVFAGKVYPTTFSNAFSSAIKEAPLQRLSRLQAELKDLASDLQQDTTTDASTTDSAQKLLLELQKNLEDNITPLAIQQSSQLQARSSAAVERLQSEAPASSTTTSQQPSTALEQRLQRLELAVGRQGSGNSGSPVLPNSTATSLLERLSALETAHSQLDEAASDVWHRRAKTIRQDLEAAAKAKNKLNSSTGNASDTATIAELYNLAQQIQGLAPHLPALHQRLATLNQLHSTAATWPARLQATEQAVTLLQTHVAATEGAVEQLQESVRENAKQMEENVKHLEERIQKLDK